MILQNRAYAGRQYVYRAYHNNKIIWDHGDYANGVVIGSLDASAMPEPVDPTPIQLHAEATIDGTGKAHTMELISIQAHTDATIAAESKPRAVQTIRSAGKAEADIQAVGAASSFGQVFTAAHATAELSAQAMPRPVETAYGAGVADASIIGSICPTVVEFLDILASAGVTIAGSATPQPQAPAQVIGRTEAELTAIGCPVSLPFYTVTFMYNGEELYKTRVVEGNACPDPVSSGEISAPTKEMTVQYVYEHSGWSMTEGGDADESALASIMGDTVVYAAFKESIRYYTVTFYDEGTLVETVSVPYGSTAVTSYVKKGYKVTGYVPSNENIVADTACNLQFGEFTFASATWAEIAEVSEANKAADYFDIGDERVETIAGTQMTLVIVDFDYDYYMPDGATVSKKAGMTIVPKSSHTTSTTRIGASYGGTYANCTLATTVNNLRSNMPADLQAVVKKARKLYTDASGNTQTIEQYVWLLSLGEIYTSPNKGTNERRNGRPYKGFTNNPELREIPDKNYYWTRTMNGKYNSWFIAQTKQETGYTYTGNTSRYYIRFGFCV